MTVTVTDVVNAHDAPEKPSDLTLTIRDDEDSPTVTLVLGSDSVSESGSTTVTAELSHASSEETSMDLAVTGRWGRSRWHDTVHQSGVRRRANL